MHPLYVVQELSARCYAGCPNCFRNFVKGPFDGDMTPETFENAQRGIPKGTMILPQFHGESLLHPFFSVMMKKYKDAGLRVSMPASGSAGEKYIPDMVGPDTPVYILIISIDGFCSYSHNTRRGNISLERASLFAEKCLKERGDRDKPWIAVRWVDGEQSEKEFELYLKHWLFEVGVDFILRSRMFNYGSKYNSPVSVSQMKCKALVEGAPVVLFNGDVLLCERVNDREKYIIGNVNKDDWSTIMKRREEMTKEYPENDPCKLCSSAYIFTGFMGVQYLRHAENVKEAQPIYTHSDHSQMFYSLTKNWAGINWGLK